MSEPVSVMDRAATAPRDTLAIEERGPVGQVTLRADLASPAVAEAVRATLGVELPETRTCAFGEDGRGAVWMAPDELLVLCGYDEAGDVAARLEAALADEHATAVVMSDARAVLRLAGPDVAETLAKGAPVDLSGAAFPVGAARRTHLAHVAVGFWRREAVVWELVCFRSYAAYVWDWLVASGAPGARVGRF